MKYTIKSTSQEGTYYLVNGWNKHKTFWVEEKDLKSNMLFNTTGQAKASLTKLLNHGSGGGACRGGGPGQPVQSSGGEPAAGRCGHSGGYHRGLSGKGAGKTPFGAGGYGNAGAAVRQRSSGDDRRDGAAPG